MRSIPLAFLRAVSPFVVSQQSSSPGAGAPTVSKGRQTGQRFRHCPDCPEMVVIPEGSFTMGSPTENR
jgi:formylglycine-generating enzyme required for sulfatase activity